MSLQCFIGKIRISNIFSATHILFDNRTEHVDSLRNMYIYSTDYHVLSRMIMHY